MGVKLQDFWTINRTFTNRSKVRTRPKKEIACRCLDQTRPFHFTQCVCVFFFLLAVLFFQVQPMFKSNHTWNFHESCNLMIFFFACYFLWPKSEETMGNITNNGWPRWYHNFSTWAVNKTLGCLLIIWGLIGDYNKPLWLWPVMKESA